MGTLGDLAQAVRREVVAWSPSAATHRLVLNLSLGWSPARFGGSGTEANFSPPVLAVYRALQDASCRQVLTVAAAGKRSR